MNEACTLIRDAAGNEDVQINFGVVMNEAMGDEVKITVIATGFERENLPAIARRNSRSAASPEPLYEPGPSPQMELKQSEPLRFEPPVEVEPEPLRMEQPREEAPMAMAAAATGSSTATNGSPAAEPLFDDLDVPAILRRDRRMIQ